MEKLYSLSINGTMLYFIGDVPPCNYKDIDEIARQVDINISDNDYEDFCKTFISYISSKLNIQLKQIKISYVFRKR